MTVGNVGEPSLLIKCLGLGIARVDRGRKLGTMGQKQGGPAQALSFDANLNKIWNLPLRVVSEPSGHRGNNTSTAACYQACPDCRQTVQSRRVPRAEKAHHFGNTYWDSKDVIREIFDMKFSKETPGADEIVRQHPSRAVGYEPLIHARPALFSVANGCQASRRSRSADVLA